MKYIKHTLPALLAITIVFFNGEFIRVDAYNGDVIVYVTDTGECYHRDRCIYLKSSRAISLEVATRSYRACSRCDPPVLGQDSPNDTDPYYTYGERVQMAREEQARLNAQQERLKEEGEEEAREIFWSYAKIILPIVAIIMIFILAKRRKAYKEQLKIHEARCRGELPGGVPGMPFGTIIGEDGLPKQINSKYGWGPLYTFFVSSKGEVFHKDPGCSRGTLSMVHAIYLGERRPCKKCNPARPNLAWFMPYFNVKNYNKALPLKTKEEKESDSNYWWLVEVGTDLDGKPIFEKITADSPKELDEKIKKREAIGK